MRTDTRRAAKTLDAGARAFTDFQTREPALGRSKDELVQEFRNLLVEGEALLKSTTNLSGEALGKAQEHFRARLRDAKVRIDKLTVSAQRGGRKAVDATEDYVRENPWPAVGLAAGMGFMIGALALRR